MGSVNRDVSIEGEISSDGTDRPLHAPSRSWMRLCGDALNLPVSC
jgi:hypothetical protein